MWMKGGIKEVERENREEKREKMQGDRDEGR